ncbi:MAG TPA: DUF4129 domain-containing protein [Candidatus Brachybacterium merdigallinarum]|nr:DUF4129 domain-containing protein [Candidatus Brachybacterium merdigallinarum]
MNPDLPVDPDTARERVLEELSKQEYDDSPGFIDWLLATIDAWLTDLLDGIDGSSTAQAAIAIAVVLLLAVVVFLLLRRTGLIRRGASLGVAPELDAEPVLSGAQLREAAHAAITEGRLDDGAVLALRALVRDLEERTLLDVVAGMTSHEAATAAGLAFPELEGRLRQGAAAFDTAAYSVRSVRPKQAEDLLRLAEFIAESSPDLSRLEATTAPASDPFAEPEQAGRRA